MFFWALPPPFFFFFFFSNFLFSRDGPVRGEVCCANSRSERRAEVTITYEYLNPPVSQPPVNKIVAGACFRKEANVLQPLGGGLHDGCVWTLVLRQHVSQRGQNSGGLV